MLFEAVVTVQSQAVVGGRVKVIYPRESIHIVPVLT